MRNQALRADFLMLITAMIWGSAFVAQRVGMDNIGPLLFTGLRFALGAIVLLPLLIYQGRGAARHEPFLQRGLLLGGICMGLALTLGRARPPQLVLLDEPTNHLDLAAIAAVERALGEYDGALIFVTHDSAFAAALAPAREIAIASGRVSDRGLA